MGTTWRRGFGLLTMAVLVSAAACSSAQPTARVVVLTYPPATASMDAGAPGSAAATSAATATEAVTEAPTAEPSTKPTAEPTAAPTPTPLASQSAPASTAPTATPAPTGSPTASPTSPAAACTGNANNQAFFAEAAVKLKFAVYCAVLPKGWYLQAASYELNNGGYFEANYANKTKTVKLIEGNFCDIAPTCSLSPTITTASFADMAATLHDTGVSLLIAAKFGTKPAYGMHTVGLTQAETLALGPKLYKVPKP